MQKNVAGQKWRVFAFDSTTNAPKTGDAANITAKLSLDFAAATGTNDATPDELEDGYYEFILTQAETNCDDALILPESSTGNIVVIGCPAQVSPTTGGDATAANQTTIIGLLGSATVTTSSPVDPSTNTVYITRNATYDGTAKPKLAWTVAKDYTGWTGTFTINHRLSGAELMTASVTVTSSTLLNVTLTSTETALALLLTDEDFGSHPYDLQMVSGSSVDVVGPYRAYLTKDVTG